ncbi:MAG: bifunctional hydroxymethylpyrimidine kinase/phosphomethylpyrimidine kinase [Methylobacteriaceae bacterium]|nr:bifunctional hydroxymethylpyrimidine kinase/phosphomethylpyrimidine kinase [Methylobacteriaceae bacterium]
MTAIALTIAGSDSGGGAGIQADLKTFSALAVYGASVVAALTAQNTLGVQGVMAVPPDFVAAQMESVFADLRVGAVKVGMLPTAEIIGAVAAGLHHHAGPPVVLDPVMVATSGDRLIAADAVARLRTELLPLATLVTPNVPEAAALLEAPVATSEDELEAQARRILALGARAVLAKGGHFSGPESADLLVTADGTSRFATARVATRNTHGTGCTLSAAIAAGLALGFTLEEAVAAGKRYLTEALRAADALAIGGGSGPVHHFFGWWR